MCAFFVCSSFIVYLQMFTDSLSFPKDLGRCDRNVGVDSHVEGSVRKYVYSEFTWIFFSSNKNSSHLTLLLSHYLSRRSPTQLRYLSHGGRSISIPRWLHSVSCVISHRVTAVSTWQLSLNLWLQRYFFS